MIIYGVKRIELETGHISVPCNQCEHDSQWLHVYRNFFSLYFCPIIPLRKKGIIFCPNCSTELKKNAFFKQLDAKEFNHEAKHHVESIFKSAKTPFRWLIAPVLLLLFVAVLLGIGYQASETNKQFLSAYRQNPAGNVIAIAKSSTDAYPYSILYVPEVQGEEAVIFFWRYSYESLKGALRGMQSVTNSIANGKLKDHFSAPYLMSIEHLQTDDVVHVESFEATTDWKQYFPSEDSL